MKNKKWLNYTLSILLTLVVLTLVAGAGFRAGMIQNISSLRDANGARLSFAHDVRDTSRGMKGALQDGVNPQSNSLPQDFQRQMTGMDRGFDRRDGGFPAFRLIPLIVLGLLVWLGYVLVKKNGWQLSFSKVTSTPAPAAVETSSVEVEEKKESE
jgi:hypothetical protein